MIVRDVLVRAGIVDSETVCALPPAAQLFFRNLLHACDGAARFEADPDLLRAALYGRVLSRVSRKDVARWLVEIQQADLVELYTRDGRGYGRVLKYGQRDTKRRVLYPSADDDPLFTGVPEPAPSYSQSPPVPDFPVPKTRKGREVKSPHSPPPAGGGISPRRFRTADRKAARIEQIDREIAGIKTEMMDIYHPGGCAGRVQPTGAKKEKADTLRARWDDLEQERDTLAESLTKTPEKTGGMET